MTLVLSIILYYDATNYTEHILSMSDQYHMVVNIYGQHATFSSATIAFVMFWPYIIFMLSISLYDADNKYAGTIYQRIHHYMVVNIYGGQHATFSSATINGP